jgi:RNA-directed DNA polymerase
MPLGFERSLSGSHYCDVVEGNSFQINEQKVRLRGPGQRTEVTGLIVHRGVNVRREYVRNVRGLLRAWEKHGYGAAEQGLRDRHHRKHRRPGSPEVRLDQVAGGKLEFIRQVRGATNLLYVKLWNRFASLSTPRRQLKVAIAQTAAQVDDALWLLEWETGNATAFALEGVGLVTCAHCVPDGPLFAMKPAAITQQFVATTVRKDTDRDLAVLSIVEPLLSAIARGDDAAMTRGTQAIVAGFGNYAPGSGSRLLNGHITGRGIRHGVDVLYSDHRAFEGISGGPVLDANLRAIGVLQRATSSEAPGQETTILPISLLDQLGISRTGASAPVPPTSGVRPGP